MPNLTEKVKASKGKTPGSAMVTAQVLPSTPVEQSIFTYQLPGSQFAAPGSDSRLRASAGSKAGGLHGGRPAGAERSGNESR